MFTLINMRDYTLIRQMGPNRLLRRTTRHLAAFFTFRVDFPTPVLTNILLCSDLNNWYLLFELLTLYKFQS